MHHHRLARIAFSTPLASAIAAPLRFASRQSADALNISLPTLPIRVPPDSAGSLPSRSISTLPKFCRYKALISGSPTLPSPAPICHPGTTTPAMQVPTGAHRLGNHHVHQRWLRVLHHLPVGDLRDQLDAAPRPSLRSILRHCGRPRQRLSNGTRQ
jgi:hypothetical protein